MRMETLLESSEISFLPSEDLELVPEKVKEDISGIVRGAWEEIVKGSAENRPNALEAHKRLESLLEDRFSNMTRRAEGYPQYTGKDMYEIFKKMRAAGLLAFLPKI